VEAMRKEWKRSDGLQLTADPEYYKFKKKRPISDE